MKNILRLIDKKECEKLWRMQVEAFSDLLEKYKGNAVLIHIPTVKNFKEEWISDVKKAIKSASK